MRREIKFILLITLLLSGWALLKRPSQPQVSAAVITSPTEAAPSSPSHGRLLVNVAQLPLRWPEGSMALASRSPFAEPEAAKPQQAVTSAPPSLPPTPPQPEANYRFWGRMQTPEGHPLVFLTRGDSGAPAAIGVDTKLEDGWVVEAINDTSVVLVHAATNIHATVMIPPSTEASVR